MTSRFDFLVSMAQTLLFARGQWYGGATAFSDIDTAVNECSDLIPGGTRDQCEAAIAQIKRVSAAAGGRD